MITTTATKKKSRVSFAPRSQLTSLFVFDPESSIILDDNKEEYDSCGPVKNQHDATNSSRLLELALLAYCDPQDDTSSSSSSSDEDDDKDEEYYQQEIYKLDKLAALIVEDTSSDEDDYDDDNDDDDEMNKDENTPDEELDDTISLSSSSSSLEIVQELEEEQELEPQETHGHNYDHQHSNNIHSSSTTTPTTTCRRIKYYQSRSISDSVVFQRQKEHKAVQLQAWWRGRTTRRHLARMAQHHAQERLRERQMQRERQRQRQVHVEYQQRQQQVHHQRNVAATTIQAMVRRIQHQQRHARRIVQWRASVPIQALVRRFIQRAWMHQFGRRYIQLHRIQRQEQDDLQALQEITEQTKRAVRDKLLRKFHRTSMPSHTTSTSTTTLCHTRDAALMAQQAHMDEQKEYWRSQNQRLRADLTVLDQDITQERVKQQRLEASLAATLTQCQHVQQAVQDLQHSNQALELELQELQQHDEHVRIQFEIIDDHGRVETNQRTVYERTIHAMVHNLRRTTNPSNKDDMVWLVRELEAMATSDPQAAAQDVERQRHLQAIDTKKQAELQAIQQWKRQQLRAVQQEVAVEFQAAEQGHALQRRHVVEHRVYLQDQRSKLQRQVQHKQQAVKQQTAERTQLQQHIRNQVQSQHAVQGECQTLIDRNQKLQKQCLKLQTALHQQRHHWDQAVEHGQQETHAKHVLETGVYQVVQTVQQRLASSSTNTSSTDQDDAALMDSLYFLLGRLQQFEASRKDGTTTANTKHTNAKKKKKTKTAKSSSGSKKKTNSSSLRLSLSPETAVVQPFTPRQRQANTKKERDPVVLSPPTPKKSALRRATHGGTGERYTRVVVARDE